MNRRDFTIDAASLATGGFNGSFEETVAEISAVQRLIEGRPDVFTQIRRAEEIEAAKAARKLGIIFSFESAAALEDKLDRINLFRALGVRVMQLSYNMPTPFGAGVLSPPDASLTELGRQAVARMNEVGVALDLSHANAATAAAAIKASIKPVLMTHGGCASVYRHPRNKTDAELRALAEKGGVFGIYDLFYLAPSPRQPNVDDYIAHMGMRSTFAARITSVSAPTRRSTCSICRRRRGQTGTRYWPRDANRAWPRRKRIACLTRKASIVPIGRW